jgi:Gas vesicle synthesis protein GvpL/GvpF
VPQDDAARVYVYGVLSSADQTGVSVGGVEGSEVRKVEHAGVAALVSTLDADALAAASELRAHWRVLEEASKNATVLPVRFGTVMEGDAAVREKLLEPNVERLTELLGELAGRVQLNVKGDYDEDRLLREVVRASPAIAALREQIGRLPDAASYYDRIRMGELVAAEFTRHREKDEALALVRLEPVAVAVRAEPVSSQNGAFNLAFLVEKGEVDGFSEAVGALRSELGERIELRYVGPLPPYSFAETDLGAEAQAWA